MYFPLIASKTAEENISKNLSYGEDLLHAYAICTISCPNLRPYNSGMAGQIKLYFNTYCRAIQALQNGTWIKGIDPGERFSTTLSARNYFHARVDSMQKHGYRWGHGCLQLNNWMNRQYMRCSTCWSLFGVLEVKSDTKRACKNTGSKRQKNCTLECSQKWTSWICVPNGCLLPSNVKWETCMARMCGLVQEV